MLGVIVIGFSVDYTLHLGHIYKEASMMGAKVLSLLTLLVQQYKY
jgi:hypothetical protein